MSRRPDEYEIRMVEDYGEIGAGKVVEFVARDKVVPIVVPKNAPHDSQLGRMTVRGVSLEDEDIYDGDFILLRNDITKRDISKDTICAVFIHSTGELVAKKLLYGNRGDYVTLRASGGGIADLYFHADDIEIRGIVWGMQRMPDEYGSFRRRKRDIEIPF